MEKMLIDAIATGSYNVLQHGLRETQLSHLLKFIFQCQKQSLKLVSTAKYIKNHLK